MFEDNLGNLARRCLKLKCRNGWRLQLSGQILALLWILFPLIEEEGERGKKKNILESRNELCHV